jgi:hypothetical protein
MIDKDLHAFTMAITKPVPSGAARNGVALRVAP